MVNREQKIVDRMFSLMIEIGEANEPMSQAEKQFLAKIMARRLTEEGIPARAGEVWGIILEPEPEPPAEEPFLPIHDYTLRCPCGSELTCRGPMIGGGALLPAETKCLQCQRPLSEGAAILPPTVDVLPLPSAVDAFDQAMDDLSAAKARLYEAFMAAGPAQIPDTGAKT